MMLRRDFLNGVVASVGTQSGYPVSETYQIFNSEHTAFRLTRAGKYRTARLKWLEVLDSYQSLARRPDANGIMSPPPWEKVVDTLFFLGYCEWRAGSHQDAIRHWKGAMAEYSRAAHTTVQFDCSTSTVIQMLAENKYPSAFASLAIAVPLMHDHNPNVDLTLSENAMNEGIAFAREGKYLDAVKRVADFQSDRASNILSAFCYLALRQARDAEDRFLFTIVNAHTYPEAPYYSCATFAASEALSYAKLFR